MWKEWLYLTRAERRGVIVLVVIIIASLTAGVLYSGNDNKSDDEDDSFLAEYAEFEKSLNEADSKRDKREYTHSDGKRELTPFTFNPNRADSATLTALGLPRWMVSNILKYRNKGGKFRRADDFAKMYGLSEDDFERLMPYINIDSADVRRDTAASLIARVRTDSIIKYALGTTVEINSADTGELKKIPGVGSAIAQMIVAYRDKLGGYFSIGQLEEIHLKSNVLAQWFSVDTTRLRHVEINKWGVNHLRSHPYINFYQAKDIVEHRHRYGSIKSVDELRWYDDFSDDDIRKLAPYVVY